ncbi:DUF4345 domain-containing protein [Leucobacter sp. NPDC058333]|uniref:DUF4345 domain-containing protein n=1 Tax=Leucobacter sp. NPDC058333 TaxID=3346450 RepID=UPI003667A2A5
MAAVLAILGIVPVASGLSGIILGPAGAPGGEPTTASVDSEYRFTNVFWFAAGIALWWSLFQPVERRKVTRAMLLIAAIGGIARLLSVLVSGWPHPVFIAALVLELLVVPLVIWWHAHVTATEKAARQP